MEKPLRPLPSRVQPARYLNDQSQTLGASTRENLAQWADASHHALGSYRQTSPTGSSITDRWAGIRAKVARIKTRVVGWRQKVVGGAKKMRARMGVWRQKASEAMARVRTKISVWRGRTDAASASRKASQAGGRMEAVRPLREPFFCPRDGCGTCSFPSVTWVRYLALDRRFS